MIDAAIYAEAGRIRDTLLVLAIVLPVAGVLLAVVFGRHAERIALAVLPIGLGIALAILADVWSAGEALTYILGAWPPPLGVALRADGISAVMLVTTAVVICAVGLFARADFATAEGAGEARAPWVFWTLLLAVWAALNTAFLGGDLFNLYVSSC